MKPDRERESSPLRRRIGSLAGRSIIFCLLTLLAPAQSLGSDTSSNAAGKIDRQTLITIWSRASARLQNSLVRDLQVGRTYVLYETQENTANLLRWAADNNEKQILQGLASLYVMAFPFARQRDSLVLPYAGPVDIFGRQAREWTVKLPTPVYAWLPENQDDPFEGILSSAQFLYAVARLSRALVASDAPRQPFLTQARTLLLDHLRRWVLGVPYVPGEFQTTGWGCSVGTFNHSQHIQNLSERSYGTAKYPRYWLSAPPKYCNAVTDDDVFIILVAGEILTLNELSPTEFEIEPAFRQQFKEYLTKGLQLLRERFHKTSIKNLGGGSQGALFFDLGMWDDYDDYRFSGYRFA